MSLSKCPICNDTANRPDIDKLLAASTPHHAIAAKYPAYSPALIATHATQHNRVDTAALSRYQRQQHREAMAKIAIAGVAFRVQRLNRLLEDLDAVQQQRASAAQDRAAKGYQLIPGELTGLFTNKGVLDATYIEALRKVLERAQMETSDLHSEEPGQDKGSNITIITGATSQTVAIMGSGDERRSVTDGRSSPKNDSVADISLLKRLETQLLQADQLPSTQSVIGAVLDGEYSVHEAEDGSEAPDEEDD